MKENIRADKWKSVVVLGTIVEQTMGERNVNEIHGQPSGFLENILNRSDQSETKKTNQSDSRAAKQVCLVHLRAFE